MRCNVSVLAEKKTLHATERDRPDVVVAREQWLSDAELREFDRLIFFDESGLNLSMTRAYGRAPRGERVLGSVPKNWGDSITLTAGVALRGLLAPMWIVGAMTADVFETYVEKLVLRELRPGDIVIVDNLAAHKRSSIAELISAAGAKLRFLPPYSPDLSPIEPCWSKLKTFIRGASARTVDALEMAMAAAIKTVALSDARGWFRHCGYAVP